MNKAKFTEGPWKMDIRGESLIGKNDRAVGVWSCGLTGVNKSVEAVANSKLIAFSPEMYEMLERYVKLVEDDREEEFLSSYREIKSLLEKAVGEL